MGNTYGYGGDAAGGANGSDAGASVAATSDVLNGSLMTVMSDGAEPRPLWRSQSTLHRDAEAWKELIQLRTMMVNDARQIDAALSRIEDRFNKRVAEVGAGREQTLPPELAVGRHWVAMVTDELCRAHPESSPEDLGRRLTVHLRDLLAMEN